MKIKEQIVDRREEDASLSFYIEVENDKGESVEIDIYDAELWQEEDETRCRDITGAQWIGAALRLAYEAGKNGEELSIVSTHEDSDTISTYEE